MPIMCPMAENYQAYLLRLTRTQTNGRWRATLQNVHTGEAWHFATEEEMVRHLLQTLAHSPNEAQSAASPEEQSNSNALRRT